MFGESSAAQDRIDSELMPDLMPRMDGAGLARFFHLDTVGLNGDGCCRYGVSALDAFADLWTQLLHFGGSARRQRCLSVDSRFQFVGQR